MINPYQVDKIKILGVTKETDIDYTFTLDYSNPVGPGQFLQLSIPGVGEAPISISDYEQNRLYLTIRKVGSLTDKIFELKEGDYIFARGPYGNGFKVNDYIDKHVKVIAGGTGLAPVKKVVKLFMKSNNVKSLEMLLGFKSPKDILFKDEVAKWVTTGKAHITVDQSNEDWGGHTGLITQYIDLLDLCDLDETVFIVVGPPIMMKYTTLELLKKGVNETNIWVSFERKMSCGIGKCGHCKIDETYVCLEGPVFNYLKAKNLMD